MALPDGLTEHEILRCSKLPFVRAFIRAFCDDSVTTEQRRQATAEVQDFLEGWSGELDAPFEPAEGEPRVFSEASGETLAETMTAAGIKPGTKMVPS